MRRWHQRTLTAAIIAVLLTVVAVPATALAASYQYALNRYVDDFTTVSSAVGTVAGGKVQIAATTPPGTRVVIQTYAAGGGILYASSGAGLGLVHTWRRRRRAVPLLLVLHRWSTQRNDSAQLLEVRMNRNMRRRRWSARRGGRGRGGLRDLGRGRSRRRARCRTLHGSRAGAEPGESRPPPSGVPCRPARNRRHRPVDVPAPRRPGGHPVLDRAGSLVERLRARAVGESRGRDRRVVLDAQATSRRAAARCGWMPARGSSRRSSCRTRSTPRRSRLRGRASPTIW